MDDSSGLVQINYKISASEVVKLFNIRFVGLFNDFSTQ